jgi:hypothetical protein
LSILLSCHYSTLLLSQIAVAVGGFVPATVAKFPRSSKVPCYRIYSWEQRASQNDGREAFDDSSEAANLWSSPASSISSFNPFASSLPSKGQAATNNVISLRSTRMKEITNEMLNAYPNRDQMLLILQSHEEFLLEPLEDDLAVQDVDSIYRNCTNRTERYRRFEQSMVDRQRSVRDESVRQVLTMLNDFILSHENAM